MLLVLLLMISMMAIAALVVLTPMKFQIERDREEEMIHRGVQYTRAIRRYFKKLGRYPTKLEDLDSSNNTRYLRKHYKDPVTGQDFKLLHYGDPGVRMGGAAGLLGQGVQPNLNPGSDPSQPGAFGGNAPTFGSGPSGSPPGSPFSGPGQQQGSGGAAGGQTAGNPTDNSTPGQAPGDANSGGAYTANSPGVATSGTDAAGAPQSTGFGNGNQSFGGGAIVGVASASKKDTIREFNHKKRYNEWQFMYDPSSDRGGIPMTPNQPMLPGVGNLNGPTGVNPLGQPNQNGSPNSNGNNPQDNSSPSPGTSPPGPIQQ